MCTCVGEGGLPLPLAGGSAPLGHAAAGVHGVLFGVVLEEAVLVPVQVVDQVAVATVLSHQVQGP